MIVDCNALTWEQINHGDQDADEGFVEHYHACIPWLHHHGIMHKVQAYEAVIDYEIVRNGKMIGEQFHETIWNVFILFPRDEDSVLFKLTWL